MTNDTPLFTTFPTQAGIGYKYNDDPAPAVQVPASQTRAARLDATGDFRAWSELVLRCLEGYGPDGATWMELGATLNLHHGQISGRLSKMHERGLVFTLQATRNHCHPYVHWKYRDQWRPNDRRDEPVKTKAAFDRDVLRRAYVYVDMLRTMDPGTHEYRLTVQSLLAVLEERQ